HYALMSASFGELEASSLFCPRCRQANPVHKRLLLVLPTGNKYDYTCKVCGTAVGGKTDNDPTDFYGTRGPRRPARPPPPPRGRVGQQAGGPPALLCVGRAPSPDAGRGQGPPAVLALRLDLLRQPGPRRGGHRRAGGPSAPDTPGRAPASGHARPARRVHRAG